MSTYLAKEIFDNLKASVQNEINWIKRTERAILEYGSDDYKPPAIVGALQQGLSLLIDRSRLIPSIPLREEFIRSYASPIISELLGFMFQRCQEAEGPTVLADDDALIKVSQTVNAARDAESTLT